MVWHGKRAEAATHPGPITSVCKRGRTPLKTSSICCSELFRLTDARWESVSCVEGEWNKTGYPGRSGDAQVLVQVGVDDQVGRVGLDDLCAVGLELVSEWFKPRNRGTKVVARLRALSSWG